MSYLQPCCVENGGYVSTMEAKDFVIGLAHVRVHPTYRCDALLGVAITSTVEL